MLSRLARRSSGRRVAAVASTAGRRGMATIEVTCTEMQCSKRVHADTLSLGGQKWGPIRSN